MTQATIKFGFGSNSSSRLRRSTPSFILPRDAGEEKRRGLELSIAIERSEMVERFEQYLDELQISLTLLHLAFFRYAKTHGADAFDLGFQNIAGFELFLKFRRVWVSGGDQIARI